MSTNFDVIRTHIMRPDRYIHESIHHDALARCDQLTVTVDKFIAVLDYYLAAPSAERLYLLHAELDNLQVSNTKARKIDAIEAAKHKSPR